MRHSVPSSSKGLTIKKLKVKTILIISLYFGIFQGIMPILGYMGGFYLSFIIPVFSNSSFSTLTFKHIPITNT